MAMFSSWMTPAKRLLVAFTIVVLYFYHTIRMFSDETTRWNLMWRHEDAFSLLFVIVSMATIAFLGYEWVCRKGFERLRHAYKVLFLGALALVPLPHIPWHVVIPVVGYAAFRPRTRLFGLGKNICLIVSPLVPILFFQILGWKEVGPALETYPEFAASAPGGSEGKPSVFLFIYDEWSYPLSTTNGKFRDCFPNLSKLQEQSFFFEKAYSPDDNTSVSIPGILFQSNGRVQRRSEGFFWKCNGTETPIQKVPSIFHLAKENGYRTILLGFYLNYRAMLGDRIEYCHQHCIDYLQEGNFLLKMLFGLMRNTQFQKDPIQQEIWRNYIRFHTHGEYWYSMKESIHDEIFRTIEQAPRNTFVFAHWPIPHPPHIFENDGSYRPPRKGGFTFRPADYNRSLRCLDVEVGAFVRKLKECGKFDRSLIILTSDHSLRSKFPGNVIGPEWKRRVPLVIKWPGQKSRISIKEPFVTTNLEPLLRLAFDGESTVSEAQEIIREITGIGDSTYPEEDIGPRTITTKKSKTKIR